MLTMHHMVSDGWSMGVFERELAALYVAFSHGEPDPLPPLEVQYVDYTLWQREWLAGPALEEQAEYWRTLAGAPALCELPTDRPRPAQQDFNGGFVHFEARTGAGRGGARAEQAPRHDVVHDAAHRLPALLARGAATTWSSGRCRPTATSARSSP